MRPAPWPVLSEPPRRRVPELAFPSFLTLLQPLEPQTEAKRKPRLQTSPYLLTDCGRRERLASGRISLVAILCPEHVTCPRRCEILARGERKPAASQSMRTGGERYALQAMPSHS
jgi:hypothetical protein